jgi:hypothetical protein
MEGAFLSPSSSFATGCEQAKEETMLVPDQQFAESILDALDERSYQQFSPGIYGVEKSEARCWAEQRCMMINALLDWLERRMRTPQLGEPLWQATAILCDHLMSSRSMLLQEAGDLEAPELALGRAMSNQ